MPELHPAFDIDPLSERERLDRLEAAIVRLRDHVDTTMAELLLEINRLEDRLEGRDRA